MIRAPAAAARSSSAATGAEARHAASRREPPARPTTRAGAERGEPDHDSHEPHHLAEQPPRLIARGRLTGERPVVVGGLDGAHVTTPPRGTGRRAGGSR